MTKLSILSKTLKANSGKEKSKLLIKHEGAPSNKTSVATSLQVY